MTGKKVQLPWGKATVEEEATIPAGAGGRPVELGVARLSGADGEQLLRFFYRADGRIVRGPLTLAALGGRGARAELRKQPALRGSSRGSAGEALGQGSRRSRASSGVARRGDRRELLRVGPHARARDRPRSSRSRAPATALAATRCQVPMPPSAAAANGPT